MSQRTKSSRGPVPRIFPSPFLDLVDELLAHRKRKASPMVVIPTGQKPESMIKKLRQAIGRYAKQ